MDPKLLKNVEEHKRAKARSERPEKGGNQQSMSEMKLIEQKLSPERINTIKKLSKVIDCDVCSPLIC